MDEESCCGKNKFIVKNWRKMFFDKKSDKRTRNTRTISMF